MDFVAVFSFFSENVALTPRQRLAELICVVALLVLLTAATAVLLIFKIKKHRAHAQTEKNDDASEK